VWYKRIKSQESRLIISKGIYRGGRVLILDPVKEIGGIRPRLLIKDYYNTGVILLILRLSTRVSLSRLAFKD
jgi:hypothetical protein